jgi:hypothetical protein
VQAEVASLRASAQEEREAASASISAARLETAARAEEAAANRVRLAAEVGDVAVARDAAMRRAALLEVLTTAPHVDWTCIGILK